MGVVGATVTGDVHIVSGAGLQADKGDAVGIGGGVGTAAGCEPLRTVLYGVAGGIAVTPYYGGTHVGAAYHVHVSRLRAVLYVVYHQVVNIVVVVSILIGDIES